MQFAAISPYDATYGIVSEDFSTVRAISPISQQEMPACEYLSRFPVSAVVPASSTEEASAALSAATDRSYALNFTLLLFDKAINGGDEDDCLTEVAEALEHLISEESNKTYVLDIMCASPLPLDASQPKPETLAKFRRVKSFVHELISLQPKLTQLRTAWHAMQNHELLKQKDFQAVTGTLLGRGVFRQLAVETKSVESLHNVLSRIVFDPAIKSACDARVLRAFVSEYESLLGRDSKTRLTHEAKSIPAQVAESDWEGEDQADKPKSASDSMMGSVAYARVQKQIDQIAKNYAIGNDRAADELTEQLIASQTADQANHSYVVKSLCNIAARCSIAGRQKISLKCLQRALQFENGIDTILYLQIGDELRDLRNFNEAIDCYNKARALDNGSHTAGIRDALIKVSSEKGDYLAAIEQYRSIPYFEDQSSILNRLGTLYRKIGLISDARACYSRSWSLVADYLGNHVARIGLAEVWKQTGDVHRAIREYNFVLRKRENIGESSAKVYQLGVCNLLRMSGQVAKSEKILNSLLSQYPLDPDVNLQLAKTLLLLNKPEEARARFNHTSRESVRDIAIELYVASMQMMEPRKQGVGKTNADVITEYLPENQGLASCKVAVLSLQERQFEQAALVIENAKFVDKTQADLGQVIRFHALKKLSPSLSYKENLVLRRIAKRGWSVLKKSVYAIEESNFAEAMSLEREAFLKVA